MAKTRETKTEQQLPKIAKAATGAAYKRARRVGAVVVYRDGEIRRIGASGKSTLVKKHEPRVRIAKGTKFTLKSAKA